MSVFNKPLDAIAITDIEALKSAGVQESQYLDYKRDAYGGDTKELLRDITSFANAYGGEIVVGVGEDGNGRPQSIPGIADYKSECTRYEQSAMTGIDPRIPGLKVFVVPLADPARGAVIISIPRSSRAPHMVTVGGEDRFWRRHGRHKNRMTTADIGESFRLGREYLKDSLEYLEAAKGAVLNAGAPEPTLVLGALPALLPERPISPCEHWARTFLEEPTNKKCREFGLHPVRNEHGQVYEEVRPTLRGLVRSHRRRPEFPHLALHRNGYLELRENYVLDGDPGREHEIEFRYLASHCVDFFRLAARLHATIGYDGEVLAFGTIVRSTGLMLRDLPIVLDSGFDPRHGVADVRECPETPNLAVEPWSYSTSEKPELQAQRLADIVYNAFGHDKAPSVTDGTYGLR